MSFLRYGAYKDSGVEWLGEVPGHWTTKRLGHFFEERREKVSDKDYAPLSVTKGGVLPQLETAAKTDDGDNRKLVCAGDFVINGRSDRKGSSGISNRDGSVSLINIVLCPASTIAPRFVHQLLRSSPFQEEFYRYGKGIVADLWSTNFSEMKNILLAVPPLHEQTAIAVFLDRETAKIDALVEEQQRLIVLLEEKRQAVISHTVTKGLNPDARMKDVGIEWLGEVPAHWRVTRIKHIIKSFEQGWSPQCEGYPVEGEAEWGILKVGCVNGEVFNPEENKTLPLNLEPMPELGILEGDVLISRANTRELVGSVAVVERDHRNLLLCDKLYRARVSEQDCLPEFMAAFLGSTAARGQIELAATGASSSMLNIGQGVILDMPIPLPPIAEQLLIVAKLRKEREASACLANSVKSALALLQERRAALISAAVTGKIDVRGLSPQSAEAA